MKNKLLLCVVLMVSSIVATRAQSAKIENVLKISVNNIGTITDSKGVAGSYFFCTLDKVNRKENAYLLRIVDNNLELVKDIEVIRPKKDNLIECTFNGENFLMTFYDGDRIELVSYDKTGKQSGNKIYGDLNSTEKAIFAYTDDDEVKNKITFPIGNDAFIRVDIFGSKDEKYTIEALKNNLKPLWTFKSDLKEKQIEAPEVISTSENYVLLQVTRKKNMMTRDMFHALVLLDAKTGKKIMEVDPKKQKEIYSVINCFIDETTKEIVSIGEYFKPGDNIINGKSLGLYATKHDLTGKLISSNKITWVGDVSKFKAFAANGKMKDGGFTYFHKIYRAPNGNYVLIGEQYKKIVSGTGVALTLLSGGQSAGLADFKILDMVAMELDSTFKLTNFQIIDKNENVIGLPAGYGSLSSGMLALVIKSRGLFDYAFSSEDKERGRLFSSYVSYMRKKETGGKKGTTYVGTIIYDNGITIDKLPLSTDADQYMVKPGKPGYITIVEYYRKKKTIEMRSEKVNF
jgi:hypothetical protein